MVMLVLTRASEREYFRKWKDSTRPLPAIEIADTVPDYILQAVGARYFVDPGPPVAMERVDPAYLRELSDVLGTPLKIAPSSAARGRMVYDWQQVSLDLHGFMDTVAIQYAEDAAARALDIQEAFSRRRHRKLPTEIDNDVLRAKIRPMVQQAIQGVLRQSQAAIDVLADWSGFDNHTVGRLGAGLNERQANALLKQIAGWDESGLAHSEILKRADAYADTAREYRARTILETELSKAEHAAQQAQYEWAAQTEFAAFTITRVWITARDERVCPRCGPMNNKVVGVTDEFSSEVVGDTVMWPPLHPRCRCHVVMMVSGRGQ
jgi:SPP1 gp7 family putative phage head morphogenesis protein